MPTKLAGEEIRTRVFRHSTTEQRMLEGTLLVVVVVGPCVLPRFLDAARETWKPTEIRGLSELRRQFPAQEGQSQGREADGGWE